MRTIEWHDGIVVTFDQSKLPAKQVMLHLKNHKEVADAIKTMKIRGAPLLGAAASFALALTAYHSDAKNRKKFLDELEQTAKTIRNTRPTAVNLFWALDRVLQKVEAAPGSVSYLASLTVREAVKIADEDAAANRLIGKHGARLIQDGDSVLTHCNAGALATVDYGTALGVIRAAWEQEKRITVFVDETRPLLQGSRLTACELKREGIPMTLITDGMAGYVMQKRLVNKVIVGADRIVRDAVINKIGTFTIAVLAKEHKIPFYVAAPKSTFDLSRKASDVIIEERKPEEVTHIGSQRIAPKGVKAINPAFDITPIRYVSAIICEEGILRRGDLSKLKVNRYK
jgi:methylthioribose-1-phosphate isomerase